MRLYHPVVKIAFGLILFMFVVGINKIQAQPECVISIDTPMPVCPDTYFELSVFEAPHQVYEWLKLAGSTYVPVGEEAVLGISLPETTQFIVKVRDTLTSLSCESDPFQVTVHPVIHIEFVQYQLTCTNGDNANGKNAKVGASASGAFQPNEYHYIWDVLPLQLAPGDSSLAIGLKANQNYSITVKDNFGCATRDTFRTKAYYNPQVEIFMEPKDTVYLQNPAMTYSFENLSADSIAISNFYWEIFEGDTLFSSDLATPTYRYNSVGEFTTYLTVFNPQGCDTTFATTATVRPVKLYIPNVFTPGSPDGGNDFFVITTQENIDNNTVDSEDLSLYYQQSRLVVFNRQGRKVFEAENYKNTWDGDKLEDGVYYYVLECKGAKSTDVFKGSVAIIRSN